MGQQQLLLIVLGTIIVGIAVAVGINMMGNAQEQANLDAVRQDLLTIASSAQGYFAKPTMMAGGGNSFTGITLDHISFPADSIVGNTAYNQNAEYTMAAPTDSTVTISAVPTSDDAITITAVIEKGDMSLTQTP
jgi:Tfp pilus assembly protein PilE